MDASSNGPVGWQAHDVIERGDSAWAGQAIYTPTVLRAYDAVVLGFALPVLWGCSIVHLEALYDHLASARHLEVGVGTGYFLDRCAFPKNPSITLADANPASLEASRERVQRYNPKVVQCNVLEPLPLPEAAFDSIGLNAVLHCLPGTFATKAVVFSHLARLLAPGGVLFGSTVLGVSRKSGLIRNAALAAYNRAGVFSNASDDETGLEAALTQHFPNVKVHVRGMVAIFQARKNS